MNPAWLLAALALGKRAEVPEEDGWTVLYLGHHYRIEGELRARAAVDVSQLRRMLEAVGARDVQIGERAPHRIAWTMTAQFTFRVRVGTVLHLSMDSDHAVLLRSVREIRSPEAVVGRRRRW